MAKVSPEWKMLQVMRKKIVGTIPMLPKDIRDRLSGYAEAFGVSQEAIYLRVFRKVLLMKGIAKPVDPKIAGPTYWWVSCQEAIDSYSSNMKAMSQIVGDVKRALTETGVEYSTDHLETTVRKKLSAEARIMFDDLREDSLVYHPFKYDELRKMVRLSAAALDEYVMERLAEAKRTATANELRRLGLIREGRLPGGETEDSGSSSERTKPLKRANLQTCVDQYLAACEEYSIRDPKLKDLEDFSGRTTSFWSKTVRKPAFLMLLIKAIDKKISLGKKNETKKFWTGVLDSVKDRIARATSSARRVTKPMSWREKRSKNISEMPEHPEAVRLNRFDEGLWNEPGVGSEEDS